MGVREVGFALYFEGDLVGTCESAWLHEERRMIDASTKDNPGGVIPGSWSRRLIGDGFQFATDSEEVANRARAKRGNFLCRLYDGQQEYECEVVAGTGAGPFDWAVSGGLKRVEGVSQTSDVSAP